MFPPNDAETEIAVASPAARKENLYFGDYFLIGELGCGGMGEVWLARHESLDRRVALKWIWTEGADSVRRQRFRMEAEAVACLNHENIIQIFEFGESDNRQFIAMELMEGGSLADQVAAGGWRITEHNARDEQKAIVQLVAIIARALDHAHQRGILHRDLKPANILIDGGGQPHIADFGLAKQLDGGPSITYGGSVIGTPNYMAPEQAGSEEGEVTTAADVYSLGGILYFLLTGRPPIEGKSVPEALALLKEGEIVPPTRVNPLVDRDIEAICVKCLERDPSCRHGSAKALAEELERWLRDEPVLTRPCGIAGRIARWSKRRPAVAGLVAALLMAVVGGAAEVSREMFKTKAAVRAQRLAREDAETALRALSDAREREVMLRDSAIDILNATVSNLTNGNRGADTQRDLLEVLEQLRHSSTNVSYIGLRAKSRWIKLGSEL